MIEARIFGIDDVFRFMEQVGNARSTDGNLEAQKLQQYLQVIGVTGPDSARALIAQLLDPVFAEHIKQRADEVHPEITGKMTAQQIVSLMANMIAAVHPFLGWKNMETGTKEYEQQTISRPPPTE